MTTRSIRTMLLAGISAAAVLGISSVAHAGAFALREQGATGQGMSFAGVAAGSGGLSSMYWNPATITMNPGWQSYNSISLINLDANIRGVASVGPTAINNVPSGQIGEFAAVPSSQVSYQLSESFWVGMTTNAPFGLVTKPNAAWSGQIYGRTSRVFSINLNPILGWKVNDWLSIAAGPTFEYIDVKLRRATGVSPASPSVTLRGDDIDIGYTIGATLTPFVGTSIGVGYRSSVGHTLGGSISAPVPLGAFGNASYVNARLNTPDLVTVGVTQAITDTLRVNVGYEFSNWSRVGTVPVVGTDGVANGRILSTLPLRYKDGHFLSFGAEYDVSQQLTVRAGAAYEWSPISSAVRSVAVPDSNRIWASLGASYRVSDKITVDVAYSHVFGKKAPININAGDVDFASPVAFNGVAKGNVDIVSLGLKYRWDDAAVARPAAVVAKY